jgi:hypothetical protein
MHNHHDNFNIGYACPGKSGLLHKGFSPSGPGQSTPRKEAHPGGFAPSKRWLETTLTYEVQWEATTPVRRLCIHACQP